MDSQRDEAATSGLLLGGLSSADELLAAIAELPDPIYIMRTVRSTEGELTELTYEYVNPAAAALLQRPVESILGHGNRELFPSAADPSIWDNYVKALDTGEPISWVVSFDEDGIKGAFRVTATAYLDGLLLITSQDVSELMETQTRLRAVIDSLLDPHIQMQPIRDSAGTIIDFELADANAAACEYTRQPYAKLIGMTLLTLVPGVSKELLGWLVSVVDTGEPLMLDDYVYEQELMGGEQRHYELRVAKMDGGITYTWRDVTDRYQESAEEQERLDQLEQFQRLTVGRELKMIELKKEIELLKKFGAPPPGADRGHPY